MKVLRYIVRGCGYLEGYGSHPGTMFLVVLTLAGFVAGVQHGLVRGLVGAGVMLVVFGSMYLYGAYGRGRDAARRKTSRVTINPLSEAKPKHRDGLESTPPEDQTL